MARLASIILQGLQAGGAAGERDFQQKQQLLQIAQQMGQQHGAQRYYATQYDRYNPPPQPAAPTLTGAGAFQEPGAPPDPFAQQSQREASQGASEYQSARNAFANAPPEVQDQYIRGQESYARERGMMELRSQLSEQQREKDLSIVSQAQKSGISPSHSPQVAAAASRLRIPDSYFTGDMTDENIQGVQAGDPGAIAQYMNTMRKPPPAALLPGRATGGKQPVTPEQAQARLDAILSGLGGSADPATVAILKDRAMRGERFSTSEVMGAVNRKQSDAKYTKKLEISALQREFDVANMAVKNNQAMWNKALEMSGLDQQRAAEKYPKLIQDLTAAKASRNELLGELHDAMQPDPVTPEAPPAQRGGPPEAAPPAPAADPSARMKALWQEFPNYTPEQIVAEYQRRHGGSR